MLILDEKYRIEPIYLVTGDTNHKDDIEQFLANFNREERDASVPYERSFFWTDGLFRESSHVSCVDTTQADETHIENAGEECRDPSAGGNHAISSQPCCEKDRI